MEEKLLVFSQDFPERLDKFVSSELSFISRSQIKKLIDDGFVLINGEQPNKSGVKLEKQDQITVFLPDPEKLDLEPEAIPLDVVYEDERVIVINKSAGMVVHPSAGHFSGTLVHALLAHTQFIAGIGGKNRPGIVHRLDKNTSGLVIVAKDDFSHQWLQDQFKYRKVEKTYFALVDGHPPTNSGIIRAPLYRSRSDRKKMAIAPSGKGKSAETHFYIEKRFTNHSYLRIKIKTGRTHQIRVHLASLKIPVVGDLVYGFSTPSIQMNRHFLHAGKLKIKLPNEKSQREFAAPLPDDLQEILKNLK